MQEIPNRIPAALRALNLAECIGEGLAALDRDWRIVYANSATLELARMPEEDLVGATLQELFPEFSGTGAEAVLKRALNGENVEPVEHYAATYQLWLELRAFPTPDGAAVFIRDVGSRKRSALDKDELYAALRAEKERLRLSEERFRIALKGSPVVVFNQDTNLTYTWIYNPDDEYRDVDWIGRNDEELGDAAADLIETKREVLRTGQGVRRELAVPGKQGPRYFDFHIEALRAPDGSIVGLTAAAADTTAQKKSPG